MISTSHGSGPEGKSHQKGTKAPMKTRTWIIIAGKFFSLCLCVFVVRFFLHDRWEDSAT